jgi:tetratricopeptide (TPR) repeat protein
MIYSAQPEDPVVTVCLSVVYTLLESSKCDEFLAKISNMTQTLNKSPYIIAASALIDVHDTFISETVLSKEQQLQGQRTKELLLLLARFSQMTGEYQRAQEYLKEALEMNQEDISLWRLLGDFQFEAGDKDKARQSFTSLLTLSDDPDTTACLKLALIKITECEYAAAYDLLMFAVQKDESVLAWLALGVCCLRMGEYQEADAALSRANELDRWYSLTWGYCTLLCIKMGRLVEAEQALTFAHSLGLKDYRLINEIIEEASDLDLGETSKDILTQLSAIKRDECYQSFESETQP